VPEWFHCHPAQRGIEIEISFSKEDDARECEGKFEAVSFSQRVRRPARLVPRAGRRRAQRADRHDNPQPGVAAVGIALAPHLVHLLPRLGRGVVKCC
jgi:hypothetical protein